MLGGGSDAQFRSGRVGLVITHGFARAADIEGPHTRAKACGVQSSEILSARNDDDLVLSTSQLPVSTS